MSIKKTKLYNKIINSNFIYYTIFSINSYIFEPELLSQDEYLVFTSLKDKFYFINENEKEKLLNDVKNRLVEILDNEYEYFKCNIFLRPKCIEEESDEIIFRPIHSASLVDQIAMACLLNGIIKDVVYDEVILNEFGKIFPSNFYGNIPSHKAEYLFKPWQKQYAKYIDIIEENYDYNKKTKKYKYEVTLDLKNFFPNINPQYIVRKMQELANVKYENEEKKCFNLILDKLVKMEINTDNINGTDKLNFYNKYLKSNKRKKVSKIDEKIYTIGIPQGLPQAYYFGNICMLDVSEVYSEVFEGDAYFYVDDSVIYTDNINEDNFIHTLKKINTNLYNKFNLSDEDGEEKYDEIELDEFFIQIHTENKSSYLEIDGDKLGNPYLNVLGKLASQTAVEMRKIFSDTEKETLLEKIKAIDYNLLLEINRINEINEINNIDFKYYLKILKRYRKFFQYRIYILSYQVDTNECDTNKVDSEIKDIKTFFQLYEESIWTAYRINQLKNNFSQNDYGVLELMFSKINKMLGIDREYCYLSKFINLLTPKTNKEIYNIILINNLKDKLTFIKGNNKHVIEEDRIISIKNVTDSSFDIFKEYNLTYEKDNLFKYVLNSTDELVRILLLNYVCYVLDVSINNNHQINKNRNYPLTYNYFRILTYLLNKNFTLTEFYNNFDDMNFDCYQVTLDYSIFEVIDHYKKYLIYPSYIDDLIRVHEFTNQLWKNGSKYLNFYTLHNQEHAIELIKCISKLIKSIDFIQIKPIDFYILFISCYFHDISMVVHPDIEYILHNENTTIIEDFIDKLIMARDENVQDFELSLRSIDEKTFKNNILKVFKEIDALIETNVRTSHAKQSAKKVKTLKDLDFLDDLIKEKISEVSIAHSYNSQDVYSRKSLARDSFVSEKFIKILLRMADLLDLSENRISKPLFNNNIDKMNDISRYHWISHSAINRFEIKSEFKINENKFKIKINKNKFKINKNKNKNKFKINKFINNYSFLQLKSIKEEIIITLYLNVKSDLPVQKNNCTLCSCSNDCNDEFILSINSINYNDNDSNKTNTCNKEHCHFICKWFVHKNYYLINELYELKKYLSRVPNNFFETDFVLKIKFIDGAKIIGENDRIYNSKFIKSIIN